MKFQKDELLFDSPALFRAFINDLDLVSKIRFSRPVTDSSGKVMIREEILVKPAVLSRLHELEGVYALPLALRISDDIVRQMRLHIATSILRELNRSEHSFIKQLFPDDSRQHHSHVLHAFEDRTLVLLSYRLLEEKPEFFRHLAVAGLLTLGIVSQQNIQAPFVNRHAFLAGFTHMLGLVDLEDWQLIPTSDDERQRRLERGALLVNRMSFVHGLSDVIRAAFFPVEQAQQVEPRFGGILHEVLPGAKAEPASAAGKDAADFSRQIHPRSRYLLSETLRIARFLYETLINPADGSAHTPESLLQRLAYNMARGYFHEGLVRAVLRRFNDIDPEIKRLTVLARIEKKCLHGGHAWAYPKPQATQILCGGSVLCCPHLQMGWTTKMVAPQRAYGRIGPPLPAATYYKCQLERELPDAPAPLETHANVNRLRVEEARPANIA